MAIKGASWNVARRLSNPNSAKKILDGIDRMDADLLVLSEAQDKYGEFADRVFERLRGMGYVTYTAEYADVIPHPSERQYITALSRLPGTRFITAQFAGRNAIITQVTDPETKAPLKGVFKHDDDRNEAARIKSAHAILDENPDFAMGDFNTAPGFTPQGWALSQMRHVPNIPIWKLPRLHSLGSRLHEMQFGDAYNTYIEGGLVDAGENEPTMTVAGRIGVAALDHILYQPSTVSADTFQRHTEIAGSDHFAISALLHGIPRA
jgi:endonuclease/exonuclease/phosphatase family metal-dependent hydrolase